MKNKTIVQLMTRHPVTIGYEDPIQKGSDLMAEHHFRHLPVVDHLGEVIGILSDRDVQRAIEVKRHGAEMEFMIASHRKVKDFMSWPPYSISEKASTLEALELMLEKKISALLVLSEQNGKVRGILTSEDLLKEFARYLKETEELPTQPIMIPQGSD
jgi:CBS domain-containing protein